MIEELPMPMQEYTREHMTINRLAQQLRQWDLDLKDKKQEKKDKEKQINELNIYIAGLQTSLWSKNLENAKLWKIVNQLLQIS